MRLFALVGALLVAGGVYLLIDGGLQLRWAVHFGIFSPEVWAAHFWFLSPEAPGAGLSPNAKWLLRLVAGLLAATLGYRIIRLATR